MKKLLTVIKYEYLRRVKTVSFVVGTLLTPLIFAAFMVAPGLLVRLNVGEATRLVIVDESGKMYARARQSLSSDKKEKKGLEASDVDPTKVETSKRIEQTKEMMGNRFVVEEYPLAGRSSEEAKRALTERILKNELDAFVLIPADFLKSGDAQVYTRSTVNVFLQDSLRDALSDALVEQRFLDAKVDPKLIAEMSRKANLTATKVSERGEEKTSQAAFFIVFGLGMLLMMSQLMYGMTILTAVMEEKETRLSEVLFSSVSAFPFLMGKLIGVVLVAITQFVIWGALVGVFALYGAAVIAAQGISVSMPQIPLLHFIYAALFFILGYFTYSTLYALVGAVVTSQEESQGVSLFVVIPLVFAFYMVFPIIRNPDSRLAFWASIAPFLSPITMPVRIVAQTPPVWEIALSLLINAATVVLVTWLSSRIYRIGMLMYGKRATLPEIWRWMRQA